MIEDVPEVILFEQEEPNDIVSVVVEGKCVLCAQQVTKHLKLLLLINK